MWYVGNNKVGRIYLGDTLISRAYLGDTLVYRRNAVSIDSQIEYLESTGTQYINLGITPEANEICEIKFSCVSNDGSTIFGCRTSTTEGKFTLTENAMNKKIQAALGNHDDVTLAPFETYEHVVKINTGNGTATFDDTGLGTGGLGVSTAIPIGTFIQNNLDIYLFACNEGGIAANYSCVRIMYVKIGERMNLVPVRVGSTGYMYDTISGQTFARLGSGVFVLGPDIESPTPPEPPTPTGYDSEVEYIESNGTQYIDLGITPQSNEIYEIEYSCTNILNTGFIFGCRKSSSSEKCLLGHRTSSGGDIFAALGSQSNTTVGSLDTSKHIVKINTGTGTATFDNSGRLVSIGTFSENDLNLFLFALNQNGSVYSNGYVRIMSVKIGERMNLIPVRVGSTGYMYDTISGQMFANSGTDDFIVGPDVQEEPPAPESYVEDGLVLWLDGINIGNVRNKWVDLVSGHLFTNNNATFNSEGGYVSFNGSSSYFENSTFTPPLSGSGTIEVVYESGNNLQTAAVIFMPKSESALSSNIAFGYNGSKKYVWSVQSGRTMYNASASGSVSISNSGAFHNGVEMTSGTSTYWSGSDSNNYVGKRNSGTPYYFYGKLYCIRIYNRQLTKEEVLNNLYVDNQRFDLRLTMPLSDSEGA